MNLEKSRAVALDYFKAFETKDRSAIRKMLAERGAFVGPLSSFAEADAFLDAADVFMKLAKSVAIKEVLAEGDSAAVFWDYTAILASVPVIPVATWFRVESGKIALFHVHFDPTAIVKAMERGEIS